MQQGGLSVTTLAIASAASVAAAIVVHEVWKGGAILGAAITPVIVAIVSETLRKPVTRVTARREQRRGATREDPFGIWQDVSPRAQPRRLDRRHLRLALITGALAFAVGAIALTAAELVAGDNVGGGSNRVTLVPAERKTKRSPAPATTTPAPAATTPAPPAETAPTPETVPAPAPAPEQTEPAPAPEAAPGGTPAPEDGG